MMDDENAHLVWSFEHTAWWAPNSRGYTPRWYDAGRYSRADAERICEQANHHGVLNETFVPLRAIVGRP